MGDRLPEDRQIMADAGVEDPQACPKGLRHGFGIAAVAAGVPLPTIAAALGHATADHRDLHHRRKPRGAGFSGSDVGLEGGYSRTRRLKASGEGA